MSKQVLIVDDSEADQFLCQYVIESFDESLSIFNAYDGREALGLIDESKVSPDFIFLDINMPGMNGFEFLEAFNQRDSDNSAVIVMLTSSIKDDDYDRCMVYPQVKCFVSKPLEPEKLIACFD